MSKNGSSKPAPDVIASEIAGDEVKIPVNVEMMEDNILIQQAVNMKHGLIHLPDRTARENNQEGTIVAVGPGRRRVYTDASGAVHDHIEPMKFSVGEHIIFDPLKPGMTVIKINAVDYICIPATNVILRFQKPKPSASLAASGFPAS